MANRLWIRAKICEILMGQTNIHYTDLMKEFDSSCLKVVILVLAEMYYEHHIWSNGGIVTWRPPGKEDGILEIEELCEMIAGYATTEWDMLP